MTRRYFLPADTTAGALGADALAEQLQGALHEGETVVRNGSRGAFWLEPLLEVEEGGERIAFGPLDGRQLGELLATDYTQWREHESCLGSVAQLPWFKAQTRLTFKRAGIDDPLCLDGYLAQQGFEGLEHALHLAPEDIVEEVLRSGLRGRGGAAFPAGIKWRTVAEASAEQKYIVCNADEGDSGTFADRLLMEADPYQLIEGMAIAGLAVGATRGYIYLRSEYPRTWEVLHRAIGKAEAAGYLGDNIGNSNRAFHLELRIGAGAYICGEETAMLESLEGKRGMVRAKPPLPALEGLFGQPTVVNNVLTLAAVSTVLADGAEAYAALGMERSKGTLCLQLAGNIKRGGLLEVPFGMSVREVVEQLGGGTRSGRPIKAIQAGGPLGAYLPESAWDTPLDYEAFAGIGGMLGHGGLVVFDDTADMAAQARFAMAFCAEESCGKCTPCRVGSTRGVEVIDKIIAREDPAANMTLLEDLCDTMEHASLCAMGGLTPHPVRSAMTYFPEDFCKDVGEV
ncbi:formate dehydrogenase [Halioglobus japonicus]|uniref:NADH-quinone oxidoreductase subunit F n=1 Tax=Halioglobus japonicus TaxID=930805 RepID=A0AAP8MH84_9GAMM|nr:NADH-ubiquinone oxidoreductase-F iron-sulfur binding region domain-containing protein [Halioglobus japonicus]AQA19201.1 formate dehydrogenase [Halioglobus japonicus]PLW87762.1 formate dehydrogenase [Halioglobus japonicus]GHD06703.1 formate dehydrogenase subunit beta [Halioglobus japonicus]